MKTTILLSAILSLFAVSAAHAAEATKEATKDAAPVAGEAAPAAEKPAGEHPAAPKE